MDVVMTGATSGIGLAAIRAMLARGVTKPIIGVRNPTTIPLDLVKRVDARPLDLNSLASVRAFAATLVGAPVQALVLNAGGQIGDVTKSVDGFERTFAVNHLAHYLLIRLLTPQMASDGRIVLTASGTHDPAQNTGMPPPQHADAYMLANPATDPARDAAAGTAGRRAYSASKLCNVMTARELALRQQAERPALMVASFDPGFVPGTGLVRDYPAPVSWAFRNVLPLLLRSERISTPEVSGALLADLVLLATYVSARGDYWSVRQRQLKRVEPSILARDATASSKLWDDSAKLVGLATGVSSATS
jgi:NAD(P)-dependent dehydrogenase (short-subunit alcohol dehydrogenase family)